LVGDGELHGAGHAEAVTKAVVGLVLQLVVHVDPQSQDGALLALPQHLLPVELPVDLCRVVPTGLKTTTIN